ncbi:hypothetical protein FBD94_09755 [Pedobacter hiemivivus]|uniref:Uncharacterized protein n=1 Tax=Pedobacter hiemivivus TaxID=2530454 RepID=A0A4U1GHR8_9SPHI|nr:hypothetical protein [Pedobacter hiemivivus]TKC62490.1 hypothetical protein FBD94_09755 [Pedobacter hiemivivus]
MDFKDYFVLTISFSTLVITIISNIIEKRKENRRSIRKTLSDSLESLAKIDVEMAKLRNEEVDHNSKAIVEIRRVYNGQRRVQIVNADYLCTKHPKLVVEADCLMLAVSFRSIGDYNKAEEYWKKTISLTISDSMKQMNLRGYANFLFSLGRLEQGRTKFNEALEVNLDDTDDNRRIKVDTYIIWSDIERDYSNVSEATRLLDLAKGACARIGHTKMREEMEERILQRVIR